MTIRVQGFQTPKNGSSSQECQDALAWNAQQMTFAIADGVSDSAFQSLWANILVTSFVAEGRTMEGYSRDWLARWLQTQQNVWNSRVNWETIPWHGRLKAQQTGGQATFLGIRVLPDRNAWIGIAIGDCNLFRFGKDGRFKESVPNHRSADFSNATQAFSSTLRDHEKMLNQVKMIQGTFDPGDSLILATDAVARWMLENLEDKKDPLREIPTSASDEPGIFNQWVNAQRQSGALKDDDTSLLLIQLEPAPRPEPRPVPAPLAQQRTSQTWGYAYAFGLLLSLLVGVVVGATLHSLRSNGRIEQNVQKPLLTLQQLLESNQTSRKEIGNGLLRIIVTAQPRTDSAATAQTLLCSRLPKDPGCVPTPTATPQDGSRSK
jgi:serine/threonine protein phosphatase PrpC